MVRATVPDAEFWIVGRDPSPAVWALRTLPGVVVTGFVSRHAALHRAGRGVVVPLRFGSGMRQKILEAWAMEKCVVSTRVGAEGLDVQDGANILLADDAPALAERVIRGAPGSDPPGPHPGARAARLVSTAHDPAMLARQYHDAISAALRETSQRDEPLRAVIDLRWMRPGVAGGIENLSRSFHRSPAPARLRQPLYRARPGRGSLRLRHARPVQLHVCRGGRAGGLCAKGRPRRHAVPP